jgi:hypothetical protein
MNIKQLVRSGLFLGLLVVVAHPAMSWGRDGHRIVAAIAANHLTPAATAQVKRILEPEHFTDQAVVDWADLIKKKERKETAPWHYIDIPLEATGEAPEAYCGPKSCIVNKIKEFSLALRNPAASTTERHDALRFIIHFLGDIHQPLHCNNNHDMGGNKIPVLYAGDPHPSNFHYLWDTLIFQQLENHQDALTYAAAIDKRLGPALSDATKARTPAEWAHESHQLAQKLYSEIPEHEGAWKLTPTYAEAHRDVAERQLERGGLRLAALLNEVFAEPAHR